MRPYIVNLTDNIIGKNRLDDAFNRARAKDPNEFLKQVKFNLECGDVKDMNPKTLGKIMCAFEVGDVLASKQELFSGVCFAGDCGEMLRELVALCLAYAIQERLADPPAASGIPPYRRAVKN